MKIILSINWNSLAINVLYNALLHAKSYKVEYFAIRILALETGNLTVRIVNVLKTN